MKKGEIPRSVTAEPKAEEWQEDDDDDDDDDGDDDDDDDEEEEVKRVEEVDYEMGGTPFVCVHLVAERVNSIFDGFTRFKHSPVDCLRGWSTKGAYVTH
uniref:HDC19639 n=1 Tax=Drosophila melanogaster TaxID=7227 RepID=Q6II65_DROME|nr:TPA_inf: HDC19639 [Drosophila melanogaster]